jgi:hypothetical protein
VILGRGLRERSAVLNDTPEDHLIRAILQTRRRATVDEVERIADRIGRAPFETKIVRVPVQYRVRFQGRTLRSREPSLLAHLVKRTLGERQWHEATTPEEYLADLRRATQSPDARVLAYARWDENYAATITSIEQVIPRMRLGSEPCPNLLVVYSADRGMIRTGYMFTDLADLDLPEDVLWLR